MALAAGKDGERDRCDHEQNGRPGCGFAQDRSGATGAKGGLAACSAECGGDISALPALEQDDDDDKQTDDDVDDGNKNCEHFRPIGRTTGAKFKILPKFRGIIMVRKGGLEPPCLSAPPPQDGVSANFTTSALQWAG